ncbi:MAG: hypothetical protein ACREQW_01600, partial [Candidatus Binatia bacterium]
ITLYLPTREHAGHEGIWNHESRLRPKNRDSANHSIVFSLAVAVVDGELGPDQYADEKLCDPNVLSVVNKIALQPDASLDVHWPAAAVTRLVLRSRSGQHYETTTLYPPGHHRNRVTDDQMRQKFRKLSRSVLNATQMESVIEAVGRLEELTSLDELTAHLRQPR